MNNIVIRNIEPQEIKIGGGGEVIGITKVYVNGEDVTIGSSAYVIVPTKTSELINDSGYITNESDPTVPSYVKAISLADIQNWDNKQQALVSGTNIKTINGNSILGSGNLNVSTSYSAGTGIAISEENVISNTITSYDDLTDQPTIPTKTSDLLNDSDYVTSSELSEVAFNGSYLALSDTPDSTSDFTNDGEDGVHPYITNETDSLVNYYDKDFLYNLLPKVSDTDTFINLSPSYSSKLEIQLKATELSQDGTPTPSTPEDIHTISGSNKVVVCGKNCLNIENSESGGIDSSGNLVSGTSLWRSNEYIKVKPNTNYTLSRKTFTDGETKYIRLYEYDKNKTFISPRKEASVTSLTITTSANTEYLKWSLYSSPTQITKEYAESWKLQLELGSTATTYEPYTSQEADIDLDTLEYCKIGTYEDKFIRSNDGTWQLEKNIGKVVLDGSVDETYTTTYSAIYQNKMLYDIKNMYHNNSNYQLIMCDRLKALVGYTEYYDEGINCTVNANDFRLILNDTEYAGYTVANLRTWLSTNILTIYYVLATPTYTQITGTLAEQLENIYYNLTSYNEQTNISQVNTDLSFTINASTLKDISSL